LPAIIAWGPSALAVPCGTHAIVDLSDRLFWEGHEEIAGDGIHHPVSEWLMATRFACREQNDEFSHRIHIFGDFK
jgi:hypothetical protein